MYKSRHNIGRRSAAERVWTYKESNIAISDFNSAAVKGHTSRGENVRSSTEARSSICHGTSSSPIETSDRKVGTTSDIQDVPKKAKASSPKKVKMAANIQGGRVLKDARRRKEKAGPPMRQRMKRMACLNANAIVSFLFESGDLSGNKSQRDSSGDSNDSARRKETSVGKGTPKKDRKREETSRKVTPKKREGTPGKESAGSPDVKKMVGKKGRGGKMKRRSTEADRLVGEDVPVKLARRMASLNATAILTAMTDKMVKPARKVTASQEKRTPTKTVVSDDGTETTNVTCSTAQVTPTAMAPVSSTETNTAYTNVVVYSSATENCTFTGISDIKKMMASVTSTSTSPDVLITNVEPPKMPPCSSVPSPSRGRGLLYPPSEGVIHSPQRPTGRATNFSGSSTPGEMHSPTERRTATGEHKSPSGRTGQCQPTQYGHLQCVMPQMYFNPAVNYPSPGGQSKDLQQPHMVDYNRPLASNMPSGYNMMLMSSTSVNTVPAVQAPMLRASAPIQLKSEKPCGVTAPPPGAHYNRQLMQPRYTPQISGSFAQHDNRFTAVKPSEANCVQYGHFPVGGGSPRKTKLPSNDSVDNCKKDFVLSCVPGANETTLHSVGDPNIVYGGVRNNFSTTGGGYAIEHGESAPPVLLMNVQGCTHERRAHNSSLMGNVCMYPYPHSKGIEATGTNCPTYAVSDGGMTYETLLPYPRSFGSAFTVPSFSGIEYSEDYSYFHPVTPDSCYLPHPLTAPHPQAPHPLTAPHPQVKLLVHNSPQGRPVIDQEGGRGAVVKPPLVLPAPTATAVVQPAREGKLGQLTTLEKVGRNPQTALGKSGKVQRRTSNNGNGVGKTSAKMGTGQGGGTEKATRKIDCTKVDNKPSSKKTDNPGKNDENKAKKDLQDSTNRKRKQDGVSKQDKKQQEPGKTKQKKDGEVIKSKKDQDGTKTKKSVTDGGKASKDETEAKKSKLCEPVKPKKATEVGKTKKADSEVGKTKKADSEVGKTKKADSEVGKTKKADPEVGKTKKADAEVGKTKKPDSDVGKTKKADTSAGIKQRRDSAAKSNVQPKKGAKSAMKDASDNGGSQKSRTSDKDAVKVTPGLKKKDVSVLRRNSSHGWHWEGEPGKKPVFCKVDEPPVMHDCYPSIRHDDGDTIRVRDCVLVKSGPRKKDIPFIGKVASFWQATDNEMMMSVLWYYRPEHTDSERLPQFVSGEIFASKHRDAIPVACVDDKCHVLTFNQYCRYRAEQCCLEQGQLSLARHVPKSPEASTSDSACTPSSSDSACMPSLDADLETVFLCRRVYDIKLKRVLKNPQVQWRDTPRLSSSSTVGSETALSVNTHLVNSGSILAPASKNLSP